MSADRTPERRGDTGRLPDPSAADLRARGPAEGRVMGLQGVRLFLVDSDPSIRPALQGMLNSDGIHAEVFSSAEDALAALARQPCHAIVTDLCLEGRDGLSLIAEVRRRFPWLPIVVVTAHGSVSSAVAAMKMGAVDFLEKPLDRYRLLAAIQKAVRAAAGPVPYPREPLSDMETRVLRLFLAGLTARQTAEILNRSSRTIEAHRQRLMQKFGVHNAVQLAQKAAVFWTDNRNP